jgi:hypothetical protein
MDDRIASVQREIRVLRMMTLSLFGLIALGALLAAARAPLKGAAGGGKVDTFDEVTVGRLNIAGPDGVNRLVLSHKMPQAPFQGEMLERTVPPGLAGMIYCAPNGDEVGGIGASGSDRGGHALIALDYRNTPLEAIGLVTRYGPEGQAAALSIMDNPTGTVDIKKIKANDEAEIQRLQTMMVNRISLGVEQHNASLAIRDRNGKARIVIGVDADNNAEIKLLDESGNPVARLPAKP